MTESQLQKLVLEYLRKAGYYAWRQHSVGFKGRYHSSQKGIADICFFNKRGQTVYLEIKTERGKQNEDQKKFETACIANNIPYFVIRDLGGVIEIVRKQ